MVKTLPWSFITPKVRTLYYVTCYLMGDFCDGTFIHIPNPPQLAT